MKQPYPICGFMTHLCREIKSALPRNVNHPIITFQKHDLLPNFKLPEKQSLHLYLYSMVSATTQFNPHQPNFITPHSNREMKRSWPMRGSTLVKREKEKNIEVGCMPIISLPRLLKGMKATKRKRLFSLALTNSSLERPPVEEERDAMA